MISANDQLHMPFTMMLTALLPSALSAKFLIAVYDVKCDSMLVEVCYTNFTVKYATYSFKLKLSYDDRLKISTYRDCV